MNKTRLSKAERKHHDRAILENTGRCRAEPFFASDGTMRTAHTAGDTLHIHNGEHNQPGSVYKPLKCYICKTHFVDVHHFYHRLCPDCAAYNYAYRQQSADLTGRVALVTGGRIKIGFEIALKLLRAGATVLVTTRFAQDALHRYRQQADFNQWQQRLHIYALDLKHIDSVEAFTEHLQQHFPALDILINNAAQTLRKPESYYQHMAVQEYAHRPKLEAVQALLGQFSDPHLLRALNAQQRLCGEHGEHRDGEHGGQRENENNKESANAVNVTSMGATSVNALDAVTRASMPTDEFNEPIDFSAHNSWRQRLHEIDTLAFLEAQIINATAPFLLNSRLKALMLQSPWKQRFIINVSAMEGQFNRKDKTHHHAHTNMAKAALNMMTRTAAQDYAQDGIFMNSVDTGWVTQENPFPIKQRARRGGMVPPLDCIDGAARVLAPIFDALNGRNDSGDAPAFGHFFKDYQVSAW